MVHLRQIGCMSVVRVKVGATLFLMYLTEERACGNSRGHLKMKWNFICHMGLSSKKIMCYGISIWVQFLALEFQRGLAHQRQLKGTNLKSPGFFSKKSIQLGPQPPSSQPSNIQQIVLYFSQLQAKTFSTNSFILYIWPGWYIPPRYLLCQVRYIQVGITTTTHCHAQYNMLVVSQLAILIAFEYLL